MQPALLSPVSRDYVLEPVSEATLRPALELLYHQLPQAERQIAIGQFQEQLAQGKVTGEFFFVARDGPRLDAVALAVPHQQATAFVFPPLIAGPTAAALAVPLLRTLTERLAQAGFSLGQCVRDVGDRRAGRWLVEAGFRELGRMVELEHTLAEIPDETSLWKWSPWQPGDRDRFVRTMEQTLVETLDCPELTGFRTGDELLETHAAAGDTGPEMWRLYSAETGGRREDIGLLLTTLDTSEKTLEVLYMGVVPSHRGRRLGRGLMNDALRQARDQGAVRVRLHASEANVYAMRTYEESGFVEVGASMLYLWTRGAPSAGQR